MAVGSDGLYALSADAAQAVRNSAVTATNLRLLDGVGVEAIGRLVDGRMRDGRNDRSIEIMLPCSCGHVVLACDPR
jgi:hypothetical protein